MNEQLSLEVAGEVLVLHQERAMFWARRRTLIVADVHLGKGAALRRAGIGLPSGDTRADLMRLLRLVRLFSARRLLILGDLFHTEVSAGEPTIAAFEAFRSGCPALDLVSVQGNHDRRVEQLPRGWGLKWVDEALHEPPFVFRHVPASDPRGYVLAGHVHPAFRLANATDALRLPAFHLGKMTGVLPAFGSLTGTYCISPGAEDRIIVTTPGGVFAVPGGPMLLGAS